MKSSLLSRLHRNGAAYLVSALLLLIGIPVYQALVLVPRGYGNALAATQNHHIAFYLTWIGTHSLSFLLYRILLLISFALLFTMPFSLFRIIVAQELMAQQEESEHAEADENDSEEGNYEDDENDEITDEENEEERDTLDSDDESNSIEVTDDGMPPYAWRGKGFAILGAWTGIIGVVVYVLGTLVSTIFLLTANSGITAQSHLASTTTVFLSSFSITTNTVGIGLLALAALFFGAIIARRGTRLWPGEWVGFGYMALAVSALLSGSAVAVASAPTSGQTALTSPAILLFALWIGWLGVMLVRLRSEP